MKDIKITLKTQVSADGETEKSSFSYSGRYDIKNGKHYIMYEEGSPSVKTVIKAADDSAIISRTGEIGSIMHIIPNKTVPTDYATPQGTFSFDVCGISVYNKAENGYIMLEYALKSGAGIIGQNKIEIFFEEV